jgi:hypothetical protein
VAKWALAAYHRDPEKFKARAKSRRDRDPQSGRTYATNYYWNHAEEIKEKKKVQYHANPKKFRKAARTWRKNNLPSVKANQATYRARRRELIALGERFAAKISPLNRALIRAAACLTVKGMKPYAMTDILFPPSPELAGRSKASVNQDRKRRYDNSVKDLFKKHGQRIEEDAQQNIAGLSDAECDQALARALLDAAAARSDSAPVIHRNSQASLGGARVPPKTFSLGGSRVPPHDAPA